MRFVLRFLLAWLGGFAAAVAVVVLAGRPGGDTDVPFVIAWAAIYSVPLGLLTVLPLALFAWRRRLPVPLVLLGGVAVGSLPGLLQYLWGVWSEPLAGTGDPVYLLAAAIGALVGSCLYTYSVHEHWQAA